MRIYGNDKAGEMRNGPHAAAPLGGTLFFQILKAAHDPKIQMIDIYLAEGGMVTISKDLDEELTSLLSKESAS